MAGDYILAVAAKVLAQLHHEEILVCLSQVLSDLGENYHRLFIKTR